MSIKKLMLNRIYEKLSQLWKSYDPNVSVYHSLFSGIDTLSLTVTVKRAYQKLTLFINS